MFNQECSLILLTLDENAAEHAYLIKTASEEINRPLKIWNHIPLREVKLVLNSHYSNILINLTNTFKFQLNHPWISPPIFLQERRKKDPYPSKEHWFMLKYLQIMPLLVPRYYISTQKIWSLGITWIVQWINMVVDSFVILFF